MNGLDTKEPVFRAAVRDFWMMRQGQMRKQQQRGVNDQGTRSEVTGGKQMDGFARKIAQLLISAGLKSSQIYYDKKLDLPGFYRPTKKWDIIVKTNDQLLAAIELKSQVGPSFGNNFNNRIEEALGNTMDIWTAYREGAFGASPAPWLGFLFLLEDCAKSKSPVKVDEPHFSVFKEFRGASYAKRYELFCRKIVRERNYSASCLLLSNSAFAQLENNYEEVAKDLCWSIS